ncbi:galactoside 2-alpha-L-fucosyltransferase Sec1-like isoform X1 [Macrobrachium rosenbergii]|uniref:galactoside 2-alpha-L-fucosyltransferase Sec1-like isoform X1 n=1 Tax=Macrobrachium rosenbergii TaxID=79674 RepID=UPI0034D6ED33
MKDRLRDFHHLSLPDFPGTFNTSEWKGMGTFGSLYNYAPIELAASGLFGPGKFVLREYAFEIQLFHKFKKELKREFTFHDEINTKVREFFDTIRKNASGASHADQVFVGFHIRRTDYLKHAKMMFGAKLPDSSYFDRALEHYRAKFPGKVVFVAASDDQDFVKRALIKHPDVRFSPGTSPTFDMALLSSCNHSIVTMGSYGFWSGFLTGGEVVYPEVKLQREYRFSRAMYEKVGLESFTPLPVD